MTATDQRAEAAPAQAVADNEPRLSLDLGLSEAEAVRAWLLKPPTDGTTALDDPVLNGALTKLGHAVDGIRASMIVRYELEQVGLSVAHLSDEQVRELARRVTEATFPGIRG